MLLASVLAIALALSLVGATYYFPSGQVSQSSSAPQTTSIPVPTPATAPSAGPALPTPSTLVAPTSAKGESINLIPALSVVAAIVVAIIAVLLLFSERDLKGKNWNEKNEQNITNYHVASKTNPFLMQLS
jgi:small neutral amino acid transporter SnatA (MarC family)